MITKNTFKQKLDGKVWKAIQAMVDGIKRQSERPWFRINMQMWGSAEGGLCFGCAATSTVQEVCDYDFSAKDLPIGFNREYNWINGNPAMGENSGFTKQATALNMCDYDLGDFELAIDKLRRGHSYDGDLTMIFKYMGAEYVASDLPLPELTTENYKRNLYYYQEYADKLKKLDI